jgi:ElaB/YqjD/DUF883 family membrane-anchored ribosome-binding protein
MTTKIANLNKLMSNKQHDERVRTITEKAVTAGYTTLLDGVPVSKELLEFTQALQKVMPKVKFFPHNFCVAETAGGTRIHVCEEVFVYMDDFPCDLGRISWADNGVQSGQFTYGVYSRKIQNDKYAAHRNQHHMVMTSDLEKAVKNARKHLVPYTTRELAQVFYEPLHEKVSRVLDQVKTKAHHGAGDVVNNRMAILQEIEFLKKQGVQFVTPEFRALSENVEQLLSEYREQESRKVSAVFVRFKQVGDTTYADLQEVHNVREIRWDTQMNTTDAQAISCPADELPQDIAGQIAVLNILENDGYVSGVGMKIDDKTFWVERG